MSLRHPVGCTYESRVCANLYVCINVQIHTYVQIYINTHTCTYLYVYVCWRPPFANLAMPHSDFFLRPNEFFSGSRYCAAVLFAQLPLKCKDLDFVFLNILKMGTYSKCARECNFQNYFARRSLPADVLEPWPQVCRIQITFTLPPTDRFVSATMNSMKCLVNWIPLRICVRGKTGVMADP